MCEEYGNDRFQPVLTTKGSEMIVQYDEHRLTNNYKFGIIYQTFKQVGDILDYKRQNILHFKAVGVYLQYSKF